MTFDASAYWAEHAPPIYRAHRQQETALVDVLRLLDFRSVLEVGCGDGRITALLAPMTPGTVTVADLSAERVTRTTQRVPGSVGIVSRLKDMDTDQRWDLVIAVEVLMHIPPEDIEAACDKLRALSARWIVTCDWTEPLPPGKQRGEHNWRHDYDALLQPISTVPVGRQSIHIMEAA